MSKSPEAMNMLTTGLNRRHIMAGAGAMAARGAFPLAVTAGGILVPQIAHAETLTVDVANSYVDTWTIEGKEHVYTLWYLANGDHMAFIQVKAPWNNGAVVHAVRSHVINGSRYITHYKECTREYVGPGTRYKLTFPSTHVHRVLRGKYHTDINADGTNDFRPTIVWPTGVTNLTSFDSGNAWGMHYLFYRTYRDSKNVDWVMGAVKSALDDGGTPEWIGFKAHGIGRSTIMTHINELKREFELSKSAWGTTVSTTVVGAVLVGAGAKFAYTAAAAASGVAACTLGVLWVVNTGFQWKQYKEAAANFAFDQRQFESYVRSRTASQGKVIYNP